MSLIFKGFPSGHWRTLLGGQIGFGVSPLPEYTYRVPIQSISTGEISFATVSLGDLPLITPNTLISNGTPNTYDQHVDVRVSINTKFVTPDDRERHLGDILKRFRPTRDQHQFVSALRKLVATKPQFYEAPMIAYRRSNDSQYFLITPAEEWYRLHYGRKTYLAQTFITGDKQTIRDALYVSDETHDLERDGLELDSIVPCDEGRILAIVPRTNVDDAYAPLIAQIIKNPFAFESACYAGQSLKRSSGPFDNRPSWLRFGHPFPNQDLTVRACGVKGTITTKFGKREKAILVTSLIGESPPIYPPHFVPHRENGPRSTRPLECGDGDSTAASKVTTRSIPRDAPVHPSDDPDRPILNTPDENPRPGVLSTAHFGPPFDPMGAKRPPGLLTRKARKMSESRTTTHVLPECEGPRTTNKTATKSGGAAPARANARSELEQDDAMTLFIDALVDFQNQNTIRNLKTIDFNPSEYCYKTLVLQRSPTTGRWTSIPNRTCPRLLFAASFTYKGKLIVTIDIERKSKRDTFRALLGRVTADKFSNDGRTRRATRNVALALFKARGVLGNAEIDSYFQSSKGFIHRVDTKNGKLHVDKLIKIFDSLTELGTSDAM